MSARAAEVAEGLELVPARRLTEERPLVRIPLAPGDRAVVEVGQRVDAGTPIVERLRDARLDVRPPGPPDRAEPDEASQVLFTEGDRRRVIVGEQVDSVEAPADGIVRASRWGSELTIEVDGRGLPGVLALGVPTHGRLELATDEGGELRPGSIDVGRAGTILVVGSRVDAETLTRARAMGVRGVVVSALAAKEERDFGASERRQRAGLHRLPPFGVLVLDGAIRRPIAASVMALLRALEGTEVGLSIDPPALVFGGEVGPRPDPGAVRIRHGPLAGREGQWAGPAGPRRFTGGVHLEAGFVRLDDGEVQAVPLADIERFV